LQQRRAEQVKNAWVKGWIEANASARSGDRIRAGEGDSRSGTCTHTAGWDTGQADEHRLRSGSR